MSTSGIIVPPGARRFPGMLPVECAILQGWLLDHAAAYTSIEFNVRVGVGTDPGPTFPDNIRKMSIDISRLRMDALAFTGLQPTIIEVKNRCTPQNVGQIVTYEVLYIREYPLSPPPILLIIAAAFPANTLTAIQAKGIQFYTQPVIPGLIPPRRASSNPLSVS